MNAQPLPRDKHITDRPPRCQECGKTLAGYATRPWSIRCRGCGAINKASRTGIVVVDKQQSLDHSPHI